MINNIIQLKNHEIGLNVDVLGYFKKFRPNKLIISPGLNIEQAQIVFLDFGDEHGAANLRNFGGL